MLDDIIISKYNGFTLDVINTVEEGAGKNANEKAKLNIFIAANIILCILTGNKKFDISEEMNKK